MRADAFQPFSAFEMPFSCGIRMCIYIHYIILFFQGSAVEMRLLPNLYFNLL
jgi:hypothetical protein